MPSIKEIFFEEEQQELKARIQNYANFHTERRLSYPEHRYPQDQAHRTLRQTSQGVSGNAPPDTVQ